MKILIVYSTKGGVSRRCAEILKDKLEQFAQVQIYDVRNAPPAPDGFDVAVVGGSIRMGQLNKKLRSYLKANAQTLNSINTALFICCGFS